MTRRKVLTVISDDTNDNDDGCYDNIICNDHNDNTNGNYDIRYSNV